MTATPENDPYQERYTAHQARKRDVLSQLLAERHSERMFADRPVFPPDLDSVAAAVQRAPNSCNRRAISTRVVVDRDGKALLGGLLVGGVGWVHRAPAVLLLSADPAAYKAGDEIRYMPYLDAGAAVGLMYITAGALDLACCYINPNVRDQHRGLFEQAFGDALFCGALAVGYPRVQETS